MDHIKNSPKGTDVVFSEGSGKTSAATLALQHPNDIGKLTAWEIDFRQLGVGRLSAVVAMRANSTVSVLNIEMDERAHQQGTSPSGWTTLGIPRRGTVDTWQGLDINSEVLLSFGDRGGFDGVSSAGFTASVMSFDTGRLQELAEACGFALPDDGSAVRRTISGQGSASMKRLQRRIAKILRYSDHSLSPSVEEAMMMDALVFLTQSEAHRDNTRAITRRRALRRALDVMLANLEDPLSIQEICRQSGSSWRTLERAFTEQFGQGPKTYYTRLRLNRVREALLKSSSSDRIIDSANRHGFWHMGQFARDYRLFFGELPSQTRNG